MLIISNVFRLKFGKAKEAIGLIKEAKEIAAKNGFKFGRALTDVTGISYTVILENEVDSLSDFENELSKVFSNDDWKKWYQKFIPLVESSSREIYKVID